MRKRRKPTIKQLERILNTPCDKQPEFSKPQGEPITIDELEKLLNSETNESFEILPIGLIRRGPKIVDKTKPLTMREDLGGEYGQVGRAA